MHFPVRIAPHLVSHYYFLIYEENPIDRSDCNCSPALQRSMDNATLAAWRISLIRQQYIRGFIKEFIITTVSVTSTATYKKL
jgi:hypothetical protein